MDNRLSGMVAARYASAAEIERYQTRANTGLLDWEAHVLQTYHHPGYQVLDIGCGCGREAIASSRTT